MTCIDDSNVFRIKRGDTSPALQWEIVHPEVILTAASVVFNMRRLDGDEAITRAPAEVVPAAPLPTLRYNWQPDDTAEVGQYEAEFEVTYADGTIETFPNDDNIIVRVFRDLG